MDSGAPNLEFALIADGVASDKVYPIDIKRAFDSLSRIKPAVATFWDTGALSAQTMASKEAVLGVLWSTRVQAAVDGGAPLAIEWNQNEILVQAYGIPKGAKNAAAALQFIDYSLSAEVQSRWLAAFKAIPVNKKAYPATDKALLDPATNHAVDRVERLPRRYPMVGEEPRRGQRCVVRLGDLTSRADAPPPGLTRTGAAVEPAAPDQALRAPKRWWTASMPRWPRASSSPCSAHPARARQRR